MISLILLLSLNTYRQYSDGPLDQTQRDCIMMSLELDHTDCFLGGNYYWKDGVFIYDQYCNTWIGKTHYLERKYIGVDTKECNYTRIGESEMQ